MKSKADGCGLISTVNSSIVLLCVSSTIIILRLGNTGSMSSRLLSHGVKDLLQPGLAILMEMFYKNTVVEALQIQLSVDESWI